MTAGKVIVVGNEKGGTGKSTLAMHLVASFLQQGKTVSSIDLDGRQGTLTHYIQNRADYAERHGFRLALPQHLAVTIPEDLSPSERAADEEAFAFQVEDLARESDIVLIDTPGANNSLFRLAHACADILVTPINDSLIDLDVLAKIDSETLTVTAPSHYAQAVWQARQKRLAMKKPPMEWYVLRNRLMHVSTKNEKLIRKLLDALSKRIHFTPISGLGERIVYRELFLKGLTLLDIENKKIGIDFSFSNVAARQELRQIIKAIGFPSDS